MNAIPWIESPFFDEELAKAALSAEDKAFVKSYADNGYVIFDPGISAALLDKAVEQMQPHFAKSKERIQDAWKYATAVKYLACNWKILGKLRLLYQREPIPFQTLSFAVGTEQDTHSDLIHFNTIPQRFMCGVWIALEDINDDNGPLHYYPGSHKLKFVDMIDIGVKASANRSAEKAMMVYGEDYTIFIRKMIETLGLKKETLNIKKGQAIIWSANLLHGGEKILRPGSTRFSQVTHYYFEGCIYYVPRLSDIAICKMYVSDLVNIATGKRIKSTYFGKTVHPPLLFRLKQLVRRVIK
jgi:Phytanoyl-CoA dioxygenase (PhyH)